MDGQWLLPAMIVVLVAATGSCGNNVPEGDGDPCEVDSDCLVDFICVSDEENFPEDNKTCAMSCDDDSWTCSDVAPDAPCKTCYHSAWNESYCKFDKEGCWKE